MVGSREGGGVRTPLLENSDLLNSHCKISNNRPRTPLDKQNYLLGLLPRPGKIFWIRICMYICTSEYQFNIHFQNYNPIVKNSFRVKFRDREIIRKKYISYCAFARFNGFADTSLHNAISNSIFLNNGTGIYI